MKKLSSFRNQNITLAKLLVWWFPKELAESQVLKKFLQYSALASFLSALPLLISLIGSPFLRVIELYRPSVIIGGIFSIMPFHGRQLQITYLYFSFYWWVAIIGGILTPNIWLHLKKHLSSLFLAVAYTIGVTHFFVWFIIQPTNTHVFLPPMFSPYFPIVFLALPIFFFIVGIVARFNIVKISSDFRNKILIWSAWWVIVTSIFFACVVGGLLLSFFKLLFNFPFRH